MDLRQLRYVVAVARESNFTRAAAAVHVAQPALSAGIRSLEAELGLKLFERTSRRVSMTDAGAAFVAHAGQILVDVEALSDEMAEFAGAVRGAVRLSIWYHLDPDLPQYLRAFLEENPAIQLSIREIPGPAMADALRRGEIDIAVPLLSPEFDAKDIEYEIMREEPVALAVALSHPLAAAPSVSFDQVLGLPLIGSERGTSWRSWFDAAVAPAGRAPRIVIETNEISAAIAYASIGLGFALLPRRVIDAVGQPIVAITVEGSPVLVTALAWSRTRYRGPAAKSLLAFARGLVKTNRTL